MAFVFLTREEAEMGHLPPVCMRCGAAATCLKRKNFKQLGLAGDTESWVIAPLCDAHKYHWMLRRLIVSLTLLGWLIPCCAPSLLMKINVPGMPENIGHVIQAGAAGFGLWIVLCVVLRYTSIRAKEINSSGLYLAGVDERFGEALEQYRQSPSHSQPPAFTSAVLARNQIRLTRADLETQLPTLCMRCGEPAGFWRELTYNVKEGIDARSTAVGLASLAVIGFGWISYKGPQLRLRVPLCARHSSHWRRRIFAVAFTFPIMVAPLFASFLLLPQEHKVWACSVSLLALVVWFLFAVYLRESSIHATEVSSDALTLKGMCEKFIQAFEEQRRQELQAQEYFAERSEGQEERPQGESEHYFDPRG
jgi:hypothetical protein